MSAPDTPLMDLANAASFQRKHRGVLCSDKMLAIQMRQRQKLRQAHRFVLDDASVRLVCQLSHEEGRLPHWALLARLPYDPMWIEFSLHEKVREFYRMGKLSEALDPLDLSATPERMGLLLYRDDPAKEIPRWISHCYMTGGQFIAKEWDAHEGLIRGILCYVFDPEGDPQMPMRGSLAWGAPTLSLLPDFPKVPLKVAQMDGGGDLGPRFRAYADPEMCAAGIFDGDAEEGFKPPPWLAYRTAVIIEPWYRARPDIDQHQLYKATLMQCMEEAGTLRFLIALLSAINGLPKTIKPVNPTKVRRMIGINNVPFFQHHNLTITIPGEERVMKARTILDRESNYAQRRLPKHDVRGHWRVIEYGKRTYLCRHQPTMVEHGLAICEKCELLIRWIDDHTAGDESIGYVDKTYRIATKQKRKPDDRDSHR